MSSRILSLVTYFYSSKTSNDLKARSRKSKTVSTLPPSGGGVNLAAKQNKAVMMGYYKHLHIIPASLGAIGSSDTWTGSSLTSPTFSGCSGVVREGDTTSTTFFTSTKA